MEVLAEHTADFLKLDKLVTHSSGFAFIPVSFNNVGYRNALIDHLSDSLQLVDSKQYSTPQALETAIRTVASSFHLLNIESWPTEQQNEFFYLLNLHRDAIANQQSHTILIWLPEHLLKALAIQAPDFWDWRQRSFGFVTPNESTQRVGIDWGVNNIVREAKARQIAELERQLKTSETSLQRADILHQLGLLRYAQCDYDLALNTYNEAIELYTSLGDAQSKASTQLDKANVLIDRGELDIALAVLEGKLLGVFKKLGLESQYALTQGRIADILVERGQLDKALAIREQEQLPVYKKLGALRAQAITQSKIADILQARGELDKALVIHEQEQLPLFELLGDVRSKAITQANIAANMYLIDPVGYKETIQRLLNEAESAALKMNIPEAAQIQDLKKRLLN